jgi:putative flippase GtrA
MGWLVDCMILLILSGPVALHVTLANLISSCIAALLVFTISRFLIFDARTPRPRTATLIYFFYTCAVIAVASVAIGFVAAVIAQLAKAFSVSLGGSQISFLAKVFITPPQLLANFWMSRYLIQHR